MEVVLLERIGRLGQMGDVVRVRDGYARNFLIPQGKALRASKTNLAEFEKRRVQLEAHNLELKAEAQKVAERLDGKSFTSIRQAGDTGQLYGSVSSRDIAEVVTADGFTLDRRQVVLTQPIKTIGIHTVHVSLHPEVDVTISINVARSEDEAERQSRGENVNVIREEALELETFNPDADYEDEAANPPQADGNA